MDEKAEKDDGGEFEASAFEALERDFQEILQELVGDKSLDHFRSEYEKLHRALKKSHESEKHLIKKCRELNSEIVSNAVKVQTALKLSQEDQATISALKKEIERAWKMVETSHEREQRAKDTIHNLKSEIVKLGRLVEQGAGLSINQENMVNNLVQEKNDLIKHRDMLQGSVGQLQQQNSELQAKVQKLDLEKQAGGAELGQLKDQLEQRLAETAREQAKKEKLDKELKDLRLLMDNRQKEIQQKKDEISQNNEKLKGLEDQAKQEKARLEQLHAKHEQLQDKQAELNKKKQEDQNIKFKITEENVDLRGQVQTQDDLITKMKTAKSRTHKLLEALKKKKVSDDAETAQIEASKNALKQDITALTKELESVRKQAEGDSKQITDLMHERDILNKSTIKADERGKNQVDLVKRHEGQANTLMKDVQRWKGELANKLERVHELDQQRQKYASEKAIAQGRYEDAVEQLKSRDAQLASLKKNIADVKAKLGQQKNLFEAVRTDRNLYFKNLNESLEEISEMKKKFRVMHHTIEQLKAEIKEKEDQLISVHFERQKVINESGKIKENLDKVTKAQKRLHDVCEDQKGEIKKLEGTVQEAEAERQNQRKEYQGVTSERNILGKQLIRRNEELDLLYEKIKIQQSTLMKGEIQYRGWQDSIKGQKDNIASIKLDLFKAKQAAEDIDYLKKMVYHLQRELLQERTKVKALSEELMNPMNVHRWRKLEGSDPAMYELIQKVKTLQKRLIAKTEEVVEKDLAIQDKERVYNELKRDLARQPGPEVMQQLEVQEATLEAKAKQMKAMKSELKNYQAQVGDYKDEIERLTRELQEVKRKYFEQKRREQSVRDAQRGDTKRIHTHPAGVPGRLGGGFSLSA